MIEKYIFCANIAYCQYTSNQMVKNVLHKQATQQVILQDFDARIESICVMSATRDASIRIIRTTTLY